eukprot:m.92663 g.92663  ORF g.92663 m.92663 type:complete len:68 (+) comp14673_c0_seq1:184-387(+)
MRTGFLTLIIVYKAYTTQADDNNSTTYIFHRRQETFAQRFFINSNADSMPRNCFRLGDNYHNILIAH